MRFSSSVQTISWFRDQYRDGHLTIKPPYQRNPVWASRQKCYLIESILLELPIPEVYIQQSVSPEGDASFAVVDGQQRIRTLLLFVGSDEDPSEQDCNKFTLDKLETTSPWHNQTFADLSDSDKKAFYGYQITVRYLNTDNETEVRDMFRRLNQFLTPLNAQELRNSRYTGPFVRLMVEIADDEYWAENRIISAASIRRMGDVEFVSELMIGVLHGPQGGNAAVIDAYYAQYEDYDDEFPEQRGARRLFDQTLATVRDIFPDIKVIRWGNKTDFYTLFVALAGLLRTGELPADEVAAVRDTLQVFAYNIDRRRADESAEVNGNVISYLEAVERGANDKKRRADRHVAVTDEIRQYFRPHRTNMALPQTATM